MKVGLLDRGVWGGISDLLGDLSALSSYEDALAEAVYEKLDYTVTQGGSSGQLRWVSLPAFLGPLVVTSHWL